jgi:transposase
MTHVLKPADATILVASPEGSASSSPSPTTTTPDGGPRRPNPEVTDRPTRRRFTADYKQRILAEAEAARDAGQIGALLRREGLYSSHLAEWRGTRDRAVRAALEPKKRGQKPAAPDARTLEIARLRRENERLETSLRKAELLLDLQKKVSQILDIALPVIACDDEREKSGSWRPSRSRRA